MEKVSKLQKLLPYDWRIVNELKRELTDDEFAVCVSWISFINSSLFSKDKVFLPKPFYNISQDAKIDFLSFGGWGDSEFTTIYINKSSNTLKRNIQLAKDNKKTLNKLEGVN